jgi:hypothetical protein
MSTGSIEADTHRHDAGALGERTAASIEAQVVRINAKSSVEEIAEALNACDWLLARAKTVEALMKQAAIDWIDANGPFTIGDVEHSVGYSTVTKCLNVALTAHTLLDAVTGNLDQFIHTLVAQPFKPATARSFIDQRVYASLFKTSRTGRLVHGVPERTLKRVDQRFIRSRMKMDQ